ncbi:MAG TPA: hypothetical protein VEW48_15960 [Thermoanaerobaculia bacterium]|nr:hypothetical protein [Thermoanaerobaculia bacterium]
MLESVKTPRFGVQSKFFQQVRGKFGKLEQLGVLQYRQQVLDNTQGQQ